MNTKAAMSDQFMITWIDRGGPPKAAPDPRYPDGVHIDFGKRPACRAELPYMTKKNIGTLMVGCNKCGALIAVTAASRPDDPRSVMVPCKVEIKH